MPSPETNPYQSSPESFVPQRSGAGPELPPGGPPVRPLAVVVGAVVDTFSTMAFQFFYVMVMMFRLGGSSGFEREVEHTLRTLPHQLTLYVAGGAMSVLGGFVAGTIARRHELLHGLAAGVVSVVIGKILSESGGPVPANGTEAVMAALATPLTIVSAGLGGFLAAYRRRQLAAHR